MRNACALIVVLLMFAAAGFAAAAAGLPVRGPYPATTSTSARVSHAAVVVKKTWMLPGATYKWVQPVWIATGGILLPRLSSNVTSDPWAQPPASIPVS